MRFFIVKHRVAIAVLGVKFFPSSMKSQSCSKFSGFNILGGGGELHFINFWDKVEGGVVAGRVCEGVGVPGSPPDFPYGGFDIRFFVDYNIIAQIPDT